LIETPQSIRYAAGLYQLLGQFGFERAKDLRLYGVIAHRLEQQSAHVGLGFCQPRPQPSPLHFEQCYRMLQEVKKNPFLKVNPIENKTK